jgi:hypothetical protein
VPSLPGRLDSHPCSTRLKPPSLAVLPSIFTMLGKPQRGKECKESMCAIAHLFTPSPRPSPSKGEGVEFPGFLFFSFFFALPFVLFLKDKCQSAFLSLYRSREPVNLWKAQTLSLWERILARDSAHTFFAFPLLPSGVCRAL